MPRTRLGKIGRSIWQPHTASTVGPYPLRKPALTLWSTQFLWKYLAGLNFSTSVLNVGRFSGMDHTWAQHVNSLLMWWIFSLEHHWWFRVKINLFTTGYIFIPIIIFLHLERVYSMCTGIHFNIFLVFIKCS